jgi:transposase
MDLVYKRCAGMDVHKKSIHVCVRIGKGKKLKVLTRVFGTFTADLEQLRDFLKQNKVHRVVMESTGVYWMPVRNVLERGDWKFDLVLVNPQHVHALQGDKTDDKDCRRLAELGQHNLVRGSFLPPVEIRELRDLTRWRSHVQADRNRVINRIGRRLEMANFKLGSVASNIVGKTGWLILNAIVKGETDPEQLAARAQGKLQLKKAELAEALRGYSNEHFRWLLQQLMQELTRLDTKLNEIDSRLRKQMRAHHDLVQRLSTIPGVQEITAWTLIAELGTDMSQFPTAAHAASWAGLCPGNCESAGKRQSGRTRKGDRYLRRILIQNAWAVAHKKDCFLTALFYRIASRRGAKRAAMAVAHRVLVVAYYIIRDRTVYHELGGDHYDRKNPEKTARRLTQRLERIGYQVTLNVVDGAVPDPMNTPARNGTTRWAPAARRRGHGRGPRSQLNIPGPIATPEVCRRCASWGIPCIHGHTADSSATDKSDDRSIAKPRAIPKRQAAARRGRPCKCGERGLICTHHQPSETQAGKISSPEISTT